MYFDNEYLDTKNGNSEIPIAENIPPRINVSGNHKVSENKVQNEPQQEVYSVTLKTEIPDYDANWTPNDYSNTPNTLSEWNSSIPIKQEFNNDASEISVVPKRSAIKFTFNPTSTPISAIFPPKYNNIVENNSLALENRDQEQTKKLFIQNGDVMGNNTNELLNYKIKEEQIDQDEEIVTHNLDAEKQNNENCDYIEIKNEDITVDSLNQVKSKQSNSKNHSQQKQQKDYPHVCDFCGKTFKYECHKRTHTEAVHEGKKDYQCTLCNKAFQQVCHLKTHIKSVHEGLKDKKCHFCEKAFSQASDLKKHIASVHEGLKNYKCEFCEKAYTQLHNLKAHVFNVHEGVKIHKCDQCDKVFSYNTNLKQHIISVHKKLRLYKCELCNKDFGLR